MVIILYIAALIAAIAFAVLVGFIIITLKPALYQITSTVESMKKQMEDLTTETTALLNKTNKLADDMHYKSTKLNGLFDGIKGIGETVNDFNQSLRRISTHITTAAAKDQDKAAQAVKWGAALMNLWKKNKYD